MDALADQPDAPGGIGAVCEVIPSQPPAGSGAAASITRRDGTRTIRELQQMGLDRLGRWFVTPRVMEAAEEACIALLEDKRASYRRGGLRLLDQLTKRWTEMSAEVRKQAEAELGPAIPMSGPAGQAITASDAVRLLSVHTRRVTIEESTPVSSPPQAIGQPNAT